MHCRLIIAILLTITVSAGQTKSGQLAFTRLQYSGGGDWYADPSSLPNLSEYVARTTGISISPTEDRAAIGDDTFFQSTYFYITGHGNISLSDEESQLLRVQLLAGAFLHIDDNYGLDQSIRREMKRVFPDKDFIEVPPSHPIFSTVFQFPDGLPKIHEHENKQAQGFGIFHEDRLIVFYTYESDLGDGWEDKPVHDLPDQLRDSALKMGTNIVVYSLSN